MVDAIDDLAYSLGHGDVEDLLAHGDAATVRVVRELRAARRVVSAAREFRKFHGDSNQAVTGLVYIDLCNALAELGPDRKDGEG